MTSSNNKQFRKIAENTQTDQLSILRQNLGTEITSNVFNGKFPFISKTIDTGLSVGSSWVFPQWFLMQYQETKKARGGSVQKYVTSAGFLQWRRPQKFACKTFGEHKNACVFIPKDENCADWRSQPSKRVQMRQKRSEKNGDTETRTQDPLRVMQML